MTMLLPRVDRLTVDQRLSEADGLVSPTDNDLKPDSLPAGVHYAASGGSPAEPSELAKLRNDILAIAAEEGFPAKGTVQGRARFDARAGAVLAVSHLLSSAEALRDDVWAYLASVLIPDVAVWRFPDRPAERFHGGVRNVFQRLWLRAVALDREIEGEDRWELLEALSEDALVQITERPSIGGDHRISRAFAEAWVRAAATHGRGAMEDITRAAIIRVRLRNQVQLLSAMDDEVLAAFMDIAFHDSVFVLDTLAPEDE